MPYAGDPRERAPEARGQADQMTEVSQRGMMALIADMYERLAEQAEQRGTDARRPLQARNVRILPNMATGAALPRTKIGDGCHAWEPPFPSAVALDVETQRIVYNFMLPRAITPSINQLKRLHTD